MLLSSIKRFVVLLLILLYSASTSGFTVKAHYCHDKLISISINASDIGKCCCAKKKNPAKCCDTKKVEVKVNDSHLKTNDLLFTKEFNEKWSEFKLAIFASNEKYYPNFIFVFLQFNRHFLSPDILTFIQVFRI